MEEIFKQAQCINQDGSIDVFEGYEVSNFGRIKSYKRGKERIMKTHPINKNGHQKVDLRKNNDDKMYHILVHRLILSTFNPEGWFEKAVVDHIDSNPRNNRLDNLRWFTQRENVNTEHCKQATSKALKGRFKGPNSSMYGKHLSEETRKKISEAHKGKKRSEEAKFQ